MDLSGTPSAKSQLDISEHAAQVLADSMSSILKDRFKCKLSIKKNYFNIDREIEPYHTERLPINFSIERGDSYSCRRSTDPCYGKIFFRGEVAKYDILGIYKMRVNK